MCGGGADYFAIDVPDIGIRWTSRCPDQPDEYLQTGNASVIGQRCAGLSPHSADRNN